MCVLVIKMLCTNSNTILRHTYQDFVNNSKRPNSRPPCKCLIVQMPSDERGPPLGLRPTLPELLGMKLKYICLLLFHRQRLL